MSTPLVAGDRRAVVTRERALTSRDELYAPWQPAEMLGRVGRRRLAMRMLRESGSFPHAGDRCLEVGYGKLGWLADLLEWGVRETDLHGIELDPDRAAIAQAALPAADLRVGNATQLPWPANAFRLVVVSTVFTSVLDTDIRRQLSDEITRVITPGGALLFYDFAVRSRSNPHTRAIGRAEIRRLFPALDGRIASATLAPVVSRRVAPVSWALATCLEAIPLLRTHLLAVLVKPR